MKRKMEEKKRKKSFSPGPYNPNLIYFLRPEYLHELIGEQNQINYN